MIQRACDSTGGGRLVEISGFQAGVGALLVAVKLLAGDQDVGGLRAKVTLDTLQGIARMRTEP